MKRIILVFAAVAALCSVARELSLPSVPASLREPSMRADYIAAHFWDDMDWSDTMALDLRQVAQNTANFLSVFPVMSGDSARSAAADIYLAAAVKAGEAQALAVSHALEDCLFAKESGQRDEALYAMFLERSIAAGFPDSLRAQYMLEMTCKNMPGTPAADVKFTARDGSESSLHAFADKPTMLFFYDPDCHNCHDIAMAFADDPVIKAKLIGGRMKVLALSPGDPEEWQAHGAWLPSNWTDASDGGVIEDEELYSLGTYPTIYLLDAGGTVLLKDCTPAELIEYIARKL